MRVKIPDIQFTVIFKALDSPLTMRHLFHPPLTVLLECNLNKGQFEGYFIALLWYQTVDRHFLTVSEFIEVFTSPKIC